MSSLGRGFWLHQLVEYAIALVLLLMSARTEQPALPVVVGAAILINAAISDGAMSAFKFFSRRAHRNIDWVIIAAAVTSPFIFEVDSTGRLTMIGTGLVLAVIVLGTNFAKKGAPSR